MGESPQEKDLEKTHDAYKRKKVIKNKLYHLFISNQSVCNTFQTYIKGQ